MACCAVAAYIIMRMISVHDSIKAHTNKITGDRECPESCRIKITGITCPACVETITSTLLAMPGLTKVNISHIISQALIVYTPKVVHVEDIVAKIEELGYEAENLVATQDWAADIEEADARRKRAIDEWKTALYGAGVLTILIIALGLLPASVNIYLDPYTKLWVEAVLCAMVIAFFARQIHYEAFLALKSRRSEMSLLTSLGMILSFVGSVYGIFSAKSMDASSFESTALLSCVATGGRLLKSIVVRQSVSSVSSLATLVTETAEVLTGTSQEDGTVTMALNKLQTGDLVVVGPGDIIPVDGRILDGCGNIVETHITGEILPELKSKGSHVFAGSMVHDTNLVIEVTRVGRLTWLQHTLQLMAEGDAKKARLQEMADYLAARFVFVILTLAVFTFAKPLVCEAVSLAKGLNRMIAVLLCACPCALSLSSPTAVMIGLGLASERGILLKGGSQSIEAASHTKTILFDKTGTLTTGKLSVISAQLAPYWDSSSSLRLSWWLTVLATEQLSKHPIAQAIAQEAEQNVAKLQKENPGLGKVKSARIVKFNSFLGSGVICDLQLPRVFDPTCRNRRVLIGNKRFLESNGVRDIFMTSDDDFRRMPGKDGLHVSNAMDSLIAFDNVYVGYIRSADMVRPEAIVAVRLLRSRGYRVGMITGGTTSVAHSVARTVGIHPNWVYSGLLPKEKLGVITKLRSRHGPVTMVGDNLNDVQSMTAADFSIAAFVDINSLTAITADALLLADNTPTASSHAVEGLLKIPYLFELTSNVYNKIWQNLLWAIVYNTLAVAAGTGVFESFGITLSP
ncbi:hypothetical protein BP5796_07669 [Coleophoma crateriformis]|uniref:HMA domain-containing protein n=1 Tax=Coleophoma crateriformis TaxID=565419 RepID=A0A3D8RJK4_9HELO|nr:hypothetical protein BP5796_07669 [Coleophoma crateriformis]